MPSESLKFNPELEALKEELITARVQVIGKQQERDALETEIRRHRSLPSASETLLQNLEDQQAAIDEALENVRREQEQASHKLNELLGKSRTDLTQSRQNEVQKISQVVGLKQKVERLKRNSSATDKAVIQASKQYEDLRKNIKLANEQKEVEKGNILAVKEALLPASIEDEVASLCGHYPIALFPVRVETRYARCDNPIAKCNPRDDVYGELLIRIYPDSVLVDEHEPTLDEMEVDAGNNYWTIAWENGQKEQKDDWAALVADFGSTRAAWLVEATKPEPFDGSEELNFRQIDPRPVNWQSAPESRILPDRWVVLGYRDEHEVFRTLTRPVQEPLSFSFSLGAEGKTEAINDPNDSKSEDERLSVDADMSWIYNFERAVEVGMAARINLNEHDFRQGFDLILVFGVKTTSTPDEIGKGLEDLLNHHRYTRGLAFISQGTPTNNTEKTFSGFPSPDPNGEESFITERKPSSLNTDSDGVRFMSALGLPPELADNISGANGNENLHASAMARALWPTTIGYFMHNERQSSALDYDANQIQGTQTHFVKYVRGRGPYPAFRIGDVPYGLLPITSYRDWPGLGPEYDHHSNIKPDVPLPFSPWRVWWLLADFHKAVEQAPRIGRTNDPIDNLFGTLRMSASPEQFYVRRFEDAQSLDDFHNKIAASFSGGMPPTEIPLSHTGDGERITVPGTSNPVHSFKNAQLFSCALGPNKRVPEQTGEETGPELHLGRPIEVAELEDDFLSLHPDLIPTIGISEEAEVDCSDPTNIPWILERFDPKEDDSGERPLLYWLLVSAARAECEQREDGELSTEFRTSLALLKDLPSAELERLLTETLAVCSYRVVDAWMTSLATSRLDEMRAVDQKQRGVHMGAYGWVENLRPDTYHFPEEGSDNSARSTRLSDSGGYIYAPSITHSSTAAVLRSAFLARSDNDQKPYAVNLSSARVRSALWLMDTVREGQPLGAALGYIFERGLHEGHPGLELDQFIDEFRELYSIVADNTTNQSARAEAIAARNVVDGNALLEEWRKEKKLPKKIETSIAKTSASKKEIKEAIVEEIRKIDEVVDALADLLLAESVHQFVGGSIEGVNASLDAMAKGDDPPNPEVAHVPRGGTVLYHRVCLRLEDTIKLSPQWRPNEPTPRASCEPFLNNWVGSILGDPNKIKCRVYVAREPDGAIEDGSADSSTTEAETNQNSKYVSLADLKLQPLDILGLAQTHGGAIDISKCRQIISDSELDQRILTAALIKKPDSSNSDKATTVAYNAVDYYATPEASSDISFAQTFEICRVINELLSKAKPLTPLDLLPPEDEAEIDQHGDFLATEMGQRADTVVLKLLRAKRELQKVLEPNTSTEDSHAASLRGALRSVSLFGKSAAYPIAKVSSEQLIRQGHGVMEEISRDIKSVDNAIPELTGLLAKSIDKLKLEDEQKFNNALKERSLLHISDELHAGRLDVDPDTGEAVADPIASLEKLSAKLRELLEDDLSLISRLDAALIAQAQKRIKVVLGKEFFVVPRFSPANANELRQAMTDRKSPDLGGEEQNKFISIWLAQSARIHPALRQWRRLGQYAGAMQNPFDLPKIIQLPYLAGERWVGLDFKEDKRPLAGKVSLAIYGNSQISENQAQDGNSQISENQEWGGILLANWEERIPNAKEDAAVAFHYDSPGAEAPQAVLLAVPPSPVERWSFSLLEKSLRQTLELAKVRATDGEYHPEPGAPIALPQIGINDERHAIYNEHWPMIYLLTDEESDPDFKRCLKDPPSTWGNSNIYVIP